MHDILDASLVTTTLTPRPATDVATTALATAIVPRVGVRVRAGTPDDVAFIDRMQKAHSRELGFLPTMAIAGKIRLGQVLIAEETGARSQETGEGGTSTRLPPVSSLLTPVSSPIGYLIAADRYCKRDEIGYVTQINVLPQYRRHLVAAALLQAQFDRSAYGCRLYCCWCAQDLKANDFWEAMGFTPIAFRTGSRTKGKAAGGKASPRMHIFWQKRVRAGDVSTPWWYPAKTEGGEMREDRLVFPIPPGVGWRDVLPVVLTGGEGASGLRLVAGGSAAEGAAAAVSSASQPLATSHQPLALPAPRAKARKAPPSMQSLRPPGVHPGGAWFAVPLDQLHLQPTAEDLAAEKAEIAAAKKAARAAAKAQRAKVDPRLISMARELRDRWSEQAETIAALPGKHDVKRIAVATRSAPALLLNDAA